MNYITIDDLSKETGYSSNTLKMLVVDGILPQSCGRRNKKGIYPVSCVAIIARYKELKDLSMKKSEIITLMLKEQTNGNSAA